MILGKSGSGKSVFSKSEILSVYLNNPKDQIIIVDPQGEYHQIVNRLQENAAIIFMRLPFTFLELSNPLV